MSTKIKCPHCLSDIEWKFKRFPAISDKEEASWIIDYMVCPYDDCNSIIIRLSDIDVFTCFSEDDYNNPDYEIPVFNTRTIYPITEESISIPSEVDISIAKDFKEAELILELSPKASAALSRRCLQHVLVKKAGVKKKNLYDQIQEVIDSKQLPSYLVESIDAVRQVGNFAAHPLKSTSTGEIVEVEPREAQWLIEILKLLFDFYYVLPAKNAEKKQKLNDKLKDLGKNPIP